MSLFHLILFIFILSQVTFRSQKSPFGYAYAMLRFCVVCGYTVVQEYWRRTSRDITFGSSWETCIQSNFSQTCPIHEIYISLFLSHYDEHIYILISIRKSLFV